VRTGKGQLMPMRGAISRTLPWQATTSIAVEVRLVHIRKDSMIRIVANQWWTKRAWVQLKETELILQLEIKNPSLAVGIPCVSAVL
jgi:hypothetical protein